MAKKRNSRRGEGLRLWKLAQSQGGVVQADASASNLLPERPRLGRIQLECALKDTCSSFLYTHLRAIDQICGRDLGCKRPHDPSFSVLAASLTKVEGLKMAEAFDDVGNIPEVFSILTDWLFQKVMITPLADRGSARVSAGVQGAYSHASPSFEHAEGALPRPTGLEEGLTSRNVSDPATTDAVDALLLFSQHIHAEDARVASCEQENVHVREHESGDEFQGAKHRGEKNSPDASGSSTPTQNRYKPEITVPALVQSEELPQSGDLLRPGMRRGLLEREACELPKSPEEEG